MISPGSTPPDTESLSKGIDPTVPIETSVPQVVPPIAAGRRLRLPQFMSMLLHNRKSAFGLAVLLIIVLSAIFAPLLARYSPTVYTNDFSSPPNIHHWFGTTDQGSDVFAQVVYGGRTSLAIGAGAALLATLISASLGMLAAYVGGIVDEVLNLVTNVFIVIPALPLLIVVSAYLPFRGGLMMVAIIAFTTWAGEARVLRSFALTLRNRDFVLAAKVSGESVWRIVFGEIMPNMTSRIAAGFLGAFVGAILFEAGLEFLGFGGSNGVSWGVTLFWAQNNAAMETGEWWHFLFPGLAIAITATSLIFINYGIDEISNPRLQSIKMPKEKKPRQQSEPARALPRAEQGA